MSERWVYFFGNGEAEGSRHDKELLGGKGAGLAEMVKVGVPVPPGFTIATPACRHYMAEGRLPDGLEKQAMAALARVEAATDKEFGGTRHPLLLSVRSGASVSMPGMMDTILNLGLNDATVEALARAADDDRFAWDSYRRFVQMYGDVVLGVPHAAFEEILAARRSAARVDDDTKLSADDLRALVLEYKAMIAARTGGAFPEDPHAQLDGAIRAVFESWNNERAVAYRRHEGIPDDIGTACTVMAMVYGNMGQTSGTGVAFTRDPNTGERRFFGEFLVNAQGEDVVAGIRTPIGIGRMPELLPEAFEELLEIQQRLEAHYRDMQDIEFTVERGRLYLLQTRTGKRTAAAALRIACEMVDEGLIDEREAIARIRPEDLERQLHPALDPKADATVLATGLPASPGAASGRVVFDPAEAARLGKEGEDVILVRDETSPDDFAGMAAARAVLTARGGMTSHAAVVARGMGKPCVVGARNVRIASDGTWFRAGGHTVDAGDWVTLDGVSGTVLLGRVPTIQPELSEHFHRIMGWADAIRRLDVRANADTPADAAQAREFGARGIGLCRTEHMFFGDTRVRAFREMILAEDDATRRKALDRLLPMQREDFAGIFRAMDGFPVTVRLLDPPLHEFLPHDGREIRDLADSMGRAVEEVRAAVERHREANPMLGHRGVRLGVTIPEITTMQARAIFEAAVAVAGEGVDVRPEVMIPLVSTVEELRVQAELVRTVAAEVFRAAGREVPYLVGTMIELPRAALTANRIAETAEFFSFGTNDLTQTTFGMSRDDAGGFLPFYLDRGILPADPFQVLDREGVGQLVTLGTRKGRAARSDLKVGVCGEHGGEPSSVAFFHRAGVDYVSCSPFRVPVARLAAAHAALAEAAERNEAPPREGAALETV